jgi:hypothetical protein
MNIANCECATWARCGGYFLSPHHRNCKNYDPHQEVHALEKMLTVALKCISNEVKRCGTWHEGEKAKQEIHAIGIGTTVERLEEWKKSQNQAGLDTNE